MSHSIIIILDRAEQLKGSDTTGDIAAVATAAQAADDAINNNHPNSAKLEEKLEALQEWLGGCIDHVETFTSDLAV